MAGLRNFEIESLNFLESTRQISIIFTVPILTMDGLHITRGTFLGLGVVNGQGPMRGTISNSRYRVTVNWRTDPVTDYIIISSQNTITEITTMEMTLTGFGSPTMDNLVNNQIRDAIPDMVSSPEFQAQMNEMFEGILLPLFQAVAYEKTPITIHDYLAERAANPSQPTC
jgi:hypothetical protein